MFPVPCVSFLSLRSRFFASCLVARFCFYIVPSVFFFLSLLPFVLCFVCFVHFLCFFFFPSKASCFIISSFSRVLCLSCNIISSLVLLFHLSLRVFLTSLASCTLTPFLPHLLSFYYFMSFYYLLSFYYLSFHS